MPGIVHNRTKRGSREAKMGESRFPHNFRVEKRRGRPYGTRSYLPGGAAYGKMGQRGKQVCPPMIPARKHARNVLLVWFYVAGQRT